MLISGTRLLQWRVWRFLNSVNIFKHILGKERGELGGSILFVNKYLDKHWGKLAPTLDIGLLKTAMISRGEWF